MISQNLSTIRGAIAQKTSESNRAAESVQLVAVSKRFPAEAIVEAQRTGQLLFGENYIQEAQQKYEQLNGQVHLHFIGHLQTNKAKIAAQICTMIETVDSLKLAKALNKHLLKLNKQQDILIQVKIGDDDNKSGILPSEAQKLLHDISSLPMLRPRGLMLMPPFSADAEESRPFFKKLRILAYSLQQQGLFFDKNKVELSMGMSHDYHIAIEEGATLIRIGTAIFGQRPPKNI